MTPTETLDLLDRHGLRPHRQLGQHFLADDNIVNKIVRLVGRDPGTPVLEIGAGLGTLTVALAAAGYPVRAYEVDERLQPALDEVLGVAAPGSVDIRFEDATDVDFSSSLQGSWAMASNLPYHVGTGILLDLIQRAPQITRFVVMVQAEVADRLTASPGSKIYGLPSVIAQLHVVAADRFSVPPQVFVPPPAVGSSVIVFDRLETPTPHAEAAISLARRAFGQRRKMLRTTAGVSSRDLTGAGIDPSSRPEHVSPAAFADLAGVVGDG